MLKNLTARWVASYFAMLGFVGMDHAEEVAGDPAYVEFSDILYVNIMPLDAQHYHLYHKGKCVGKYSTIPSLALAVHSYRVKSA